MVYDLSQRQEHTGIDIWRKGFTSLRIPVLYNLRSDSFERGPESLEYNDWLAHWMFTCVPAQAIVAKWLGASRSSRRATRPRAPWPTGWTRS